MRPAILLDTCAVVWLVSDEPLADPARKALDEAHQADETLWISPITAWEIGLLTSRGRLALSVAPTTWFLRLLAQPGVALCQLDPELLIDSSYLPGMPPHDPADRVILATARAQSLRVMTRDRAILSYAEAGHVSAIPC